MTRLLLMLNMLDDTTLADGLAEAPEAHHLHDSTLELEVQKRHRNRIPLGEHLGKRLIDCRSSVPFLLEPLRVVSQTLRFLSLQTRMWASNIAFSLLLATQSGAFSVSPFATRDQVSERLFLCSSVSTRTR